MLELARFFIKLDKSFSDLDSLMPGLGSSLLQQSKEKLIIQTDIAYRAFLTYVPVHTGELRSSITKEYSNLNANPTAGRVQFSSIYIPDSPHSDSKLTNAELAQYLNASPSKRSRAAQSALAKVNPPSRGDTTQHWIDQAAEAAGNAINTNG